MAQVYIVGTATTGARCWYVGMSEYLDQYKRPCQKPLFDDTEAKQVDMAFAQDAIARWGNDTLRITLEKYGPPINDIGPQSPEQDTRQPQFVPFTNGLGLLAFPGNTSKGQVWFIRAADVPLFRIDGRYTTIESISGPTPIAAAQRAVDSWGQDILFRDPEQDARDEEARKQAAQEAERQKYRQPANIRPGDRYR